MSRVRPRYDDGIVADKKYFSPPCIDRHVNQPSGLEYALWPNIAGIAGRLLDILAY